MHAQCSGRSDVQGVTKRMATPIIQNMAYFLSFHAKVMKKSHWLCLDATDESSQASQCEFFHNFCMKRYEIGHIFVL